MRLLAIVWVFGCGRSGFDTIGTDVPHVPADSEQIGETDLTIQDGAFVSLDTSGGTVVVGDLGDVVLDVKRQDGASSDLVILRARDVIVAGTLRVAGDRPLVILAASVQVSGAIDASAAGATPGPGGGRPDAGDPGEGGSVMSEDNSDTGGGGGGNAPGAGAGGEIVCATSIAGGRAGDEIGDDVLTILHGGGAGGRGGSGCLQQASGGAGGGAIQISALDTIEISGAVIASGGGGTGGRSSADCFLQEGSGGGGGAGGAIYLDAPAITNLGTLRALGGGGGAGGDSGSGLDGQAGFDGADESTPGAPGLGLGNGTGGGHGAPSQAADGEAGMCGTFNSFQTGGGGGAPGRIVLRGAVDAIGDIVPAPREIAR